MRALLLLLTASVLLWGVYQYAETSSVQADSGEQPAAVSEGRFLVDETSVVEEEAPGIVPRPELEREAPEATAWPELETPQSAPERVELAALLAHGSPSAIAERLRSEQDGLSQDEVVSILAFAEAAAGKEEAARSRLDLLKDAEALDPTFARCVRAAVGRGPAPTVLEARRAGTLPLAMAMRLISAAATRSLSEGRHAEAVGQLSQVLVAELEAPWPSNRGALGAWTQALGVAQTEYRFNRRADWPSVDLEVGDGDSLTVLRKRAIDLRPDLVVNTGLISLVNELGERYLHAGETVRVPTEPIRTLVDLSARWILVFAGEEVLAAFDCGIGHPDDPTITGNFTIGVKKENPTWFRRGREPVPFGDPENPLGTRWMGWLEEDGRTTSYGFHGTNAPESIGHAESEGCIRMRNGDAEYLFELLPRGTSVHVRE